jgi:WD40 repeat protein
MLILFFGLTAHSYSPICSDLFISDASLRVIASNLALMENSLILTQPDPNHHYIAMPLTLAKFNSELEIFLSTDRDFRLKLYFEEKTKLEISLKNERDKTKRERAIKNSELEPLKTSINVLNSASAPITDMKLTADQKYLLTASNDNEIRVTKLADPKQFYTIKDSTLIFVRPECRSFVTYTGGTSSIDPLLIREIEISKGEIIYEGRIDNISTLSVDRPIFSKDGRFVFIQYLLSSDLWMKASLIDLTQKTIQQIPAKKFNAISEDSTLLAYQPNDKTIKILDLESGKEIWSQVTNGWVGKGMFSPDNRYLVVPSPTSRPTIFDLKANDSPSSIELALSNPFGFIGFDNHNLLTYWQKGYKYFDAQTGKVKKTYKIKTTSDDKVIEIFNTDKYLILILKREQKGLPDKYSGEILDIKTLKKISDFQINNEHNSRLAIKRVVSSNNNLLALGFSDSIISLFDLNTGVEITQFELNPEHSISKMIFSPDSKSLYVSFDDGTVRSINTEK